MIWLRAGLFQLLFYLWTACLVPVSLVLLAAPARWTVRMGRAWAAGALWLLRHVVGLGFRVEGRIPREPVILASKHQSAWDTIIFLILLDAPVYVLKRELLRIPFYGWSARKAGMVPVDRAAGGSALKKMVAGARVRLAEGRPIVVFPEGTRTAPGAPPRYLPGVFALYAGADVPVVPVALDSGRFWGRRTFLKRPGTITLRFLEAMPPGLDRPRFMALLEERIEGAQPVPS